MREKARLFYSFIHLSITHLFDKSNYLFANLCCLKPKHYFIIFYMFILKGVDIWILIYSSKYSAINHFFVQ